MIDARPVSVRRRGCSRMSNEERCGNAAIKYGMGLGRFELPASSMSRRCHNQTRPQTRSGCAFERILSYPGDVIERFELPLRLAIFLMVLLCRLYQKQSGFEEPESPDRLRSRVVRDARGVSSSRKTCGLPNDLAARFVAHCVPSCSACVGRLPGPCRPFQSYPQPVDQPPGGTERGDALGERVAAAERVGAFWVLTVDARHTPKHHINHVD
mgnify:CR=1 FL=1